MILADIKYTRDSQLPWAASFSEDLHFKAILAFFILFLIVFALWIGSVKVKPVDRRDLDKLPPTMAKVIIKKKEELKRVELPKQPEVAVAKPKAESEKPKAEPEKPKAKPEKPKSTVASKPTQQDIKQAQDRAQNAGILKMKDQLASMRSAFAPKSIAAGGGIKTATATGVQGVGVSRSQIVGKGTSGSGGIAMAAGTASGTGGGVGPGRGAAQVDSITLGGNVVDDGGDVKAAMESSKSSGNRSEESIRSILDQNKASLYAIYNRALRADPALQGKVTFKLVIQPDGSVSACSIVSSDLNDESLKSKLTSRMRLIDFGEASVGVTTTQWAIDFLPY